MLAALALYYFYSRITNTDAGSHTGMKLGLANIITVYAVYRFKPSEASHDTCSQTCLGISVLPVIFPALMYSAAGGGLAALARNDFLCER